MKIFGIWVTRKALNGSVYFSYNLTCNEYVNLICQTLNFNTILTFDDVLGYSKFPRNIQIYPITTLLITILYRNLYFDLSINFQNVGMLVYLFFQQAGRISIGGWFLYLYPLLELTFNLLVTQVSYKGIVIMNAVQFLKMRPTLR